MVESEAKELSEDVMLGAVMFGHKHFQPVIEAIIRLAEKAAKEPRDFEAARARRRREGRAGGRRGRPARRLQQDRQAGALRGRRRREGEGHGRAAAAEGDAEVPAEKVKAGLQGAAGQGRALERPRHRRAHRRPRHEDRPPDRLRGRRPAARPRLVAVHARRDAGARGRDARHRRGRAVHRRARRHLQGALPAPLQLPALFASARPAAWAPRAAARSATASSPGARSVRCCRRRTSSPTRSASCRRSPSRTARPRWPRSAAARCR